MKWTSFVVGLCGLAALIIVSIGGFSRSGARGEVNMTGSTPAGVETVSHDRIRGIGFLEPKRDVSRLSFTHSGQITQVHVDIGEHVKAGQIVAEQDAAELLSELELERREHELRALELIEIRDGVNQYEVELAAQGCELAEERLQYAKRECERGRELLDSNSVSRSELDRLETLYRQAHKDFERNQLQLLLLRHRATTEALDVAKGRVEVAKARVHSKEVRIERTRLVAPYDGIVTEVLGRQGEVVSEVIPKPVMVIADMSHMRIRAEIDEQHYSHLRVGQQAWISTRVYPGKRFAGHVVSIKAMTGRKRLSNGAADERKDLDVFEVLLESQESIEGPVGLRVDVEIHGT